MLTVAKTARKSKPSFVYSIISITLVLFILGILGVILINGRKIASSLKENIIVTVVLSKDVSDDSGKKLSSRLGKRSFVKSAEYISKEEAASNFKDSYGEDFEYVLGENPLFSSVDLTLKSQFANNDSLTQIVKSLDAVNGVEEVYYPKSVLDLMNRNFRKLAVLMAIAGAIFLFIAIALIDNTIKLSMYSNRFLIKSMQLVGATRTFISRPFIKRSLIHGLISGLIASILVAFAVLWIQRKLPELPISREYWLYLYVCFMVIGVGMLISYWSTQSAVIKYLKLRLEDLY